MTDSLPYLHPTLASPSRRTMIGALAAVPVASAPVLAAAAVEPDDPTFALIEAHEKALLDLRDVCDRDDEVRAREEGRVVTEADKKAVKDANDREMRAAVLLCTTPPRTVAGFRALLKYIRGVDLEFEAVEMNDLIHSLSRSPILAS